MISVVLAARWRSGLRECLEALRPQVEAVGGELIVVHAGCIDDRPAPPPVEVRVEAEPDALVPRLWGIGLQRARLPWAALTSTDCVPAADWIAALVVAAREDPSCAAFGGPIDPPRHGSAADWGLYFARFHAFIAPPGEAPDTGVPGENVAYRRDALERAWGDPREGFWEAFVNRRLAALGETLRVRSDLRVRMADGNRLTDRARERIRHGLHYGSHRAVAGGLERGLRIAAAPLLPLWLAARAGLRVGRRRPALMPRFLVALPWTLILFGAWSLGEARGYAAQRNRIRVPTNETPATGR